jgi:ABC-type Fe3+/spermidine/putrescine transport system ATPase subunit
MVFQSYALFPHLDTAENILFGLKVRKVPVAEQHDEAAYLDTKRDLMHGEGVAPRSGHVDQFYRRHWTRLAAGRCNWTKASMSHR